MLLKKPREPAAQDHWRKVEKSRFAKIATYMGVPRNTVTRRLAQLQSWRLIDRQGRNYYLHEKTLNSLIGLRSYRQVRRILSEAIEELSVLDTLPRLTQP